MRHNLIQNSLFGLLGLLGCTVSAAALAQYAWVDGHGVRQYSDQPPPKSIPKARILQQPAESLRSSATAQMPATATAPAAGATTTDSATGAQAGAAAAAASKLPLTTADKNADFLKRQAEMAEKDKKQAEEARLAAAKARQCEQARSYARTLQSGERIAVAGKDGERAYLSDEKRVQESAEARRTLDGCR